MQMKAGIEQAVYAILLLHYLPEKAVLPGEAISQQLGTSPSYFQKILRKLVRANIISSVTGVKGGFQLQKELEEIQLYDVYVAIEGKHPFYTPRGILDCMFGETGDTTCLLTDAMNDAERAWKSELQKETIASLITSVQTEHYREEIEQVQRWVKEHMVV